MALRAGGFAAIVVVAMTVFGVSSLFAIFSWLYGVGSEGGLSAHEIPLMLVGYGFGASFVALFAQLGGGIYTKAADVGADLVGKVEAGIPEDDARNPAVVADLVGDNVGDCSARGADLFESIAAEVISAMILGGAMAKSERRGPDGVHHVPARRARVGCVVSAAAHHVRGGGRRRARTPRGKTRGPVRSSEGGIRRRARSIRRRVRGVDAIHAGGARRDGAWWHFFGCGMIGSAAAYAFVFIAQYYTDYKYPPVRVIAEASTTGHGTNIIAGVGVGMESTAAPVVVISAAIVASYWCGQTAGLVDAATGKPIGGLFGTAVATMGMLSTAAYVLTMDVFGPIADNAGGIVEMSEQPESVRDITDQLDSVGNTTKATTKGYAIGSAALGIVPPLQRVHGRGGVLHGKSLRRGGHRRSGGFRGRITRLDDCLPLHRVRVHRGGAIRAGGGHGGATPIRRATRDHDPRVQARLLPVRLHRRESSTPAR